MKCIVPLAGPDLWSERHGLRPLVNHEGTPLIEAALRPRAWASLLAPSDYVFVVRETTAHLDLVAFLKDAWPGCRIVTLSHLSAGALFSCLAATALVPADEPLIVDLADVLFHEGPADPAALFAQGAYGAIVPVFASSEPCYSYLTISDGLVTGAREKQVISGHASAGVYMFRNIEIFLGASAHSIAHRDELAHKGSLFICPMINGVIADGHSVIAPHIRDCRPAGKIFHDA
ncbi:hypothetical protein LRX75_18230 [Rhizobium sp. DKSPLA3]|uniref:Uncharacterized protein n=1 Tax=Rhizobium quercicola TaxID=2901226 RepID=A0A9X1NV66_9HYPH|nr:hypothetical protein [Rhizobium quercicola]MCD7110975.1 hypothetical protein [Rhizobium quercicola]